MGHLLTCVALILTYLSPSGMFPSIAPYRPVLVTLILGTAMSLATFAMRPVRSLQSPQYQLLLAFWAAIVISHLSHLWIRTAAYSIVDFGPTVAIFFLVSINAYSIRRIRLLAAIMIGCGIIVGLLGISAYFYETDVRYLLYRPDDERAVFGNRIRGLGILRDPNDLAQYFLVCLAFIAMFWKKGSPVRNFLLLFPSALLLFAMYLTFSRGAMLGLCALGFFLAYRKVGPVLSVTGMGLSFIVLRILQFTGNRDISVDGGRMVAWGAGIAGLLKSPLFGIGFNHFNDVNDITAHNSFVLCFAEVGLFGYFFWLALILTTVAGLWMLRKHPEVEKKDDEVLATIRSVQAALGCFLVTAFFLSRTYQETLYILLAMAANLIQMRQHLLPRIKLQLRWWAPRTILCACGSIVLIYAAVRLRTI